MDSAAAMRVLRAALECARAWEGDVRILGNVRAADLGDALDAAIAALEREQRPSSYAAVTPQTAAVGRLVEAMQPFLIVGHVEPGDERKCACRSCMLGESDRRELRDALDALTNPAREVERCPRCNAGYRHWYFTGCRSDDGWQPQHDPWHDSRPADADENKVACDCYGGTCDHTASGCPFTHPDDSQPAPVREGQAVGMEESPELRRRLDDFMHDVRVDERNNSVASCARVIARRKEIVAMFASRAIAPPRVTREDIAKALYQSRYKSPCDAISHPHRVRWCESAADAVLRLLDGVKDGA